MPSVPPGVTAPRSILEPRLFHFADLSGKAGGGR